MQTFTLKRILLYGEVSALVCLISAFSASAQNLLNDPSFELNTAGSAGGWNIVNTAVRSTGAWDPPPATGGGSQAPVERTAVFTMFHPPALPAVLSSKLGSFNKFWADAEKAEMRQTRAET